jgi:very-short-patch-repair endonuclease
MNNTHRIRGTTPEIEEAARKLRKNLTPAESRLWEFLRNKQLEGLRFRCQHPVGRFILDFYCPSCKLVVEIDGEVHQFQEDYDEARTEKLNQYGYKVLRFTNEQVMNHLSEVLAEIKYAALSSPP